MIGNFGCCYLGNVGSPMEVDLALSCSLYLVLGWIGGEGEWWILDG